MGSVRVLALLVLVEWCCGAAVRSSGVGAPGRQLRLMTKSGGEVDPPRRRGSSTMESEIAAIFRGVAYGASAQGVNGTTLMAEAPTPVSAVDAVSATTATVLPMQPAGVGGGQKGAEETPSGRGAVGATEQSQAAAPEDGAEKSTSKSKSLSESMTALPEKSESPRSPALLPTTAAPAVSRGTIVSDAETSPEEGHQSPAGTGREDLQWNAGAEWWPHVYVSAGLFTLLALVALCLMARVAVATHLLPRPHYLILHILVFFAAFLRSLHILHDAHDIKHLLPAALLVAVEETGWPCLTAALAVVVVAVLRAWRYPTRPHLAVVLAVLTAAHLITLPAAHLTAVLLEHDRLPIRMTTRAVTAAWGGTVGVGGLWAVWRESRDYSSQMTDVRAAECHPNTTHPARLVLTATLTQLLLAGLHLYMLLTPAAPASPALHAWAWWCRFIVSRGLELVVGSTLVTAAALTVARPPAHCCAFSPCCQKRTVEVVHPAEIKMIHPMGVYTLQPSRPKNEHAQTIAALSLGNAHKDKRDHTSLDYVTSDFQLVWSHGRQRPLSGAQTTPRLDDTFLQLRPDVEQDLPRAHILPLAPRSVMEPFVSTNVFSSTLPRGRVYATPETCLQYEEESKASPERGLACASKTSTMLSGSSGSSKMYSSPQIPLRASRSWDELSTGHVYEEPQRTRPGSVDEGLSDLSDVTGDYTSDLFYSDAGSPVLLRPSRRSRRRHHTACYINAKQFAAQQPISIQPPRGASGSSRDTLTPPHRAAPHQTSPHQLAPHRSHQPTSSPTSHPPPPPPPHYTTHRAAVHPPTAHNTASRHATTPDVVATKPKSHTDVY